MLSMLRVLSTVTTALILALPIGACANIFRQPVPVEAAAKATVHDLTSIRYLPLTDPEPIREMLRTAFTTETSENYEILPDGSRSYSYLSISGGGSDGAFGAGLLNGWTKTGTRPHFKVVTGVSTGALIA